MRRVSWVHTSDLDALEARGEALGDRLRRHAGVGVRGALDVDAAAAAARAVIAADALLGDDFGGEQRSLGRPWYTHLESGRAAEYFADVEASDARVEGVLPGMQARTRALLARVLGAELRQRHGFCGPGVHVFPPDEKVAHHGGVYHYDLEGLSATHRRTLAPAVSAVWMLQPAERRGGLSLYNKRFRGENWPMDEEPPVARTTTLARAGDFLVFSSHRLHRINSFGGARARVSVTCHAVMVDDGVWEVWF
jgi:hypothetical protein